MTREIAVFRGSDGSTGILGDPGTVAVFHRRQGTWELDRETIWELNANKGLRELRRQMTEMLDFLGTCKVFVAKTITGLPYYEMEKAGISTWEIAGQPRGFLDDIALQDAAARQEKPAATGPPPVTLSELAPGHFSVTIKEVQERESGVTSKQILLPLLRRNNFSILEIICNHVPPWMEAEVNSCGFVSMTEKLGNNHFKVIINKGR